MITRIEVDNFKSLCDFSIDLRPVNVFIGANGVGKSTVLQAIRFCELFAKDRLSEFFTERNWEPADVLSQLKEGDVIRMSVTFELGGQRIQWSFSVQLKYGDWIGIAEEVKTVNPDKVYLSRSGNLITRYDEVEKGQDRFPKISVKGSLLSLTDMEDEDDQKRFPLLCQLISFLGRIGSFELISPEKIRRPSGRYNGADFRQGGEGVASFISSMDYDQRVQFFEQLKNYYPSASQVSTIAKHQSDVIDLEVSESPADGITTVINMRNLSDGLLRILFFAALATVPERYSAILLDEIEDGINPDLAVGFIKNLFAISQNKTQIFVTTHSPTFLDYFDSDQVLFLWRNSSTGFAKATRVFELQELKKHLSYMNPGEVWSGYEQNELIKLISQRERGDADEAED